MSPRIANIMLSYMLQACNFEVDNTLLDNMI